MLKSLIIISIMAFSSQAYAGSPYLETPEGKFLGNLNTNEYAPDSVNNPYGRYGSEYSADSINNPYGKYGSEYSNDSVSNPYGTNSPEIHHQSGW